MIAALVGRSTFPHRKFPHDFACAALAYTKVWNVLVRSWVEAAILCYRPGSTTVLPSMLTAVCASSLPLIDAPVRNVTDV